MKEIIQYICAVCLLTLVGCNSPIHDHFIPLTNDIGDGVGCYINYTTTDGQILDVSDKNSGATIIANFYADGKGTIIFDKPITRIGDRAFCNCIALESITIPDSVTMIGDSAFYGCESLTSITIHDSVTSIGDSAFSLCESLTSITIPDSVTTIGNGAFYRCESLTSISIPDGVKTIGSYAFYHCGSLKNIIIPESVTRVENYALYYCSKLERVYCKATTPPTISGDSVFDLNRAERKIYVPEGSVDTYRAAEGWSEYADDIVGYAFVAK